MTFINNTNGVTLSARLISNNKKNNSFAKFKAFENCKISKNQLGAIKGGDDNDPILKDDLLGG